MPRCAPLERFVSEGMHDDGLDQGRKKGWKVVLFAEKASRVAATVLEETRRALLKADQAALTELMSGRGEDGAVASEADEKLHSTLQETLQKLRAEVDEFGRTLLWQFSFRRAKKLAREALDSSVKGHSL